MGIGKEKSKFLEFVLYNDEHISAVSVYFENDTGEFEWIINKNDWRNGCVYEVTTYYYTKTKIKVNHFLAYCDIENIVSYKKLRRNSG